MPAEVGPSGRWLGPWKRPPHVGRYHVSVQKEGRGPRVLSCGASWPERKVGEREVEEVRPQASEGKGVFS